MKSTNCMHRVSSLLPAVLAALIVAGCASSGPAPVRDGGRLPAAAATPQSPPPSGIHIVKPGDTLLGIARQYGVTLPDLVSWNTITDPNQIHTGQAIRVAPEQAFAQAHAAESGLENGVVVTPISAPGIAVGSAGAPVKQGPVGGREPYSDAAWAKAAPGSVVGGTVVDPAVDPASSAPDAAASAAVGEWQWPATGELLAAYNEASNKGVDISGSVGDPVHAAAAGKVAYAGSGLRGYGKLVVIKHNQEYTSVYAHNDKLLVKEDDLVVQGQKIAELGSSEAERPKLHFEIRKMGRAIDPLKYLPAR